MFKTLKQMSSFYRSFRRCCIGQTNSDKGSHFNVLQACEQSILKLKLAIALKRSVPTGDLQPRVG